MIVGDFNCDLLPENCTPLSRAILSLMNTNLLHQLISVPTRVTPHSKSLIDHVFSSILDEHQKTGVVKTHISDHYLIFTYFGYTQVKNKHVNKVIEVLKKILLLCYIFIQNLPFDEILNDTTRIMLRSKSCQWVTGDLIEAMNRRDWFYKMATKPSNHESS